MDSDALFLKKCVLLYKELGLQVHGAHVKESEMPHQVAELLEKVQPDILVLTGHDSYSKQKEKKWICVHIVIAAILLKRYVPQEKGFPPRSARDFCRRLSIPL